MGGLFQLSAPWWQFVLRGVAIYLLVVVLVRLSGKRAVGQFTPFDLILLILIGNAVQNGINGGDNSLTGAFVMATTLIVFNRIVAWISARNPRIESWVEGSPVLLARDGELYLPVLRRELISKADFEKAMRETGCEEIGDIALAVLETDGHITVSVRRNA